MHKAPAGTGGVAVPSNVRRRGRGGYSALTTPSALLEELRDIFLMRSHPSSPRRGIRFAIPQHRDHSFKLRHYREPARVCIRPDPERALPDLIGELLPRGLKRLNQ